MTTTPPRRPRLGVDFHTWDGIFQGSRSHILGLYREAIRLAPDIDFVFLLDGVDSLRDAHAEFGAPNVELVRMPHQRAPIRLGVQLPWLQWKHRIDLLHMQYRLPFVRTGACACTIHDLLFETHPQFFPRGFVLQSKLTFRHAARRAKLLFAVSQFSKGEIARLYGVPADDIAITYNGVDPQRFKPGPEGADAVRELGLEPGGYLLTVGRLEPRKNHETLIHAYAELGADAPPLVIVGQRDFSYAQIDRAVVAHGLQQRVRFLSSVGDQALPAVMRHAMAFAYPAFAEGFGMPVAEAMASGVPVITSDTTSLPEVGGAAALYADPNSSAELAAALRQVIGDAGLRERMREQGLAQVRKFDWQQSAQVLVHGVRSFFAPRFSNLAAFNPPTPSSTPDR
jgi:glycosyltransferase involved in cell wall biosynthesis